MNVTLTREDIMRLAVIDLDRDAEDALKFIRERLLPEIKRQQGMKMQSHLDGGKGSVFNPALQSCAGNTTKQEEIWHDCESQSGG